MPHCGIQGVTEVNWKPPSALLNRTHNGMDAANSMTPKMNASFFATTSFENNRMNMATTGNHSRKCNPQDAKPMELKNASMLLHHQNAEDHEHAQHDCERIRVHLPGLQPRAGPTEPARRVPGPIHQPVDDILVDEVPRSARNRQQRPHDDFVVQLVHVPLVVEYLPEPARRGRFGRGIEY